ncbi:hypothetical protein BS50DRAFT_266917 [Corynespora cassiicola Philippines]|uniref:Uncharacterized protein n=1 Tax=Corynespora cassiicola Philippines TaxID=1448308 RepID=A0A2T2NZ75_CORCC|nr:hypothetical protein BS50DRAFT_266917 [Corynespora cassiicola Philippines]
MFLRAGHSGTWPVRRRVIGFYLSVEPLDPCRCVGTESRTAAKRTSGAHAAWDLGIPTYHVRGFLWRECNHTCSQWLPWVVQRGSAANCDANMMFCGFETLATNCNRICGDVPRGRRCFCARQIVITTESTCPCRATCRHVKDDAVRPHRTSLCSLNDSQPRNALFC